MSQLIGVVVLFAMVFGSYVLSGGRFGVILHALPHALLAIGGAGAAAFLISNSAATVRATLAALPRVFTGPRWTAADYSDLLSLLYLLTKAMKSKGVITLERQIEAPGESAIFGRFPRILADPFAVSFICDTLRMTTMNLRDPHQVEDAMERQLDKIQAEARQAPQALQTLADGLPALGIVAAVLGVIKTMGAITAPPEVLGGMIGGALVGTFLGVFLSYGLVGPMAARLRDVTDEEGAFYRIIQTVLIAHLHGNAAQISVEIGRGSVPTRAQPSFLKLEQTLTDIPAEAA